MLILSIRDSIYPYLYISKQNPKPWHIILNPSMSNPYFAFLVETDPSGIPKYAATGLCPPIPPAACACGPVFPAKIPTSNTP
jgi:hypothetical protein